MSNETGRKRAPKRVEPELMSIPDNVRANVRKLARDLVHRAEHALDVLLDRVGLVRKGKAA